MPIKTDGQRPNEQILYKNKSFVGKKKKQFEGFYNL